MFQQQLNSFIIKSKIESLTDVVSYYKSRYLPHLRETTGIDQHQHLKSAEQELKDFTRDVADYKRHGKFEFLDIPKQEQAQFIRLFIVEHYELACDYSYNPLIKIPALRATVWAIQELKKLIPQLETISSRALANRHIKIKVQA